MKNRLAFLAVGAATCLFTAHVANAAPITVGSASTANGLFDIAKTDYDPLTSTTTILLDVSKFIAERPGTSPIAGLTIPVDNKFDTIFFAIEAAANEWITKVAYQEKLTTSVSPGAGTAGTVSTGSAVINGVSKGLGTFLQMTPTMGTTDFSLGTSYDIPGMDPMITLSITNNISAFAYGANASAWVTKEYAAVEVTTTRAPVPATLWLLGSAVCGLVSTRRNRHDS